MTTEKIEWYKEVVELEPASRLFFPLARMLAGSGCADEALAFLRTGLERHPDFMEARLFYVELLYKAGNVRECHAQLAYIEKMFSSYAGFWDAWGADRSASDVKDSDAGWALRFLGAVLQQKHVSLKAVMERGLSSLLADPGDSDVAVPPLRQREVSAGSAAGFVESAGPAVPGISPAPVFSELKAAPAAEAESPLVADSPAWSGGSEEVTVRTRSMAEVLAEQGDVQGALGIYAELRDNTAVPEDAADLETRIRSLKARLASAPGPSVADGVPEQISGKDRLIGMLEALAERVEARAQQG